LFDFLRVSSLLFLLGPNIPFLSFHDKVGRRNFKSWKPPPRSSSRDVSTYAQSIYLAYLHLSWRTR
jgi:hypothetical protein